VLRVDEPGVVTQAWRAVMADRCDQRSVAERICTACVEGLDADSAGISVLTGTASRETLWASDEVAELLADMQFTLNEGPCMEAAATGSPVLVADLRHSSATAHWPMFAAAVAEQSDVGALFALPLQWGTVNLGVLDLYRITPGGLDRPQRRDALAAMDTAALMMLSQRTEPEDTNGADHGWLGRELGGRAEVHQTTGMVLAQLKVSATDASFPGGGSTGRR